MRYDIFAERIDNFGDMAIALRLAEGLSTKKNPSRLFIKQDSLFLDFLKLQGKYNFELMNIEEIENNLAPAKVIISIFDAQIPHNYLNKIKQITQLYIYEYLSAETWVEDFHLKNSLSPISFLKKKYYYPGFTRNTGGLLYDKKKKKFPRSKLASKIRSSKKEGNITLSLFCYPHNDIITLIKNFRELDIPFDAYIPEELLQNKFELNLHPFPMLPMFEYDQLLELCDINFVRGEDSLCRAIFSQKPFIWQPYVQKDGIHLKKLKAFIDLFYCHADNQIRDIVREIFFEWNEGCISKEKLSKYTHHLSHIANYHVERSKQIMLNKTVFEIFQESC